MKFPLINTGDKLTSAKLKGRIEEKTTTEDSDKFPSDGYVPGDEKVSNWATFRPLEKVVATGIAGWLGGMIGGFALAGATALAPLAALGIGAAAGIGIMQGVSRLTKSNVTKSEQEATNQKKAQEKNAWQASTVGDKVGAMGAGGFLGAFGIGAGLIIMGGMAAPIALAAGAGIGAAGAVGAMLISKESDDMGSSRSSRDSSLLGMTSDGKLGLSLGGGVVRGPDGKVGFGYEL